MMGMVVEYCRKCYKPPSSAGVSDRRGASLAVSWDQHLEGAARHSPAPDYAGGYRGLRVMLLPQP